MPITPYLAGQAFEPELIREMSLALETVCDTLNLRLTDDPNTRRVASKIVELAQRGVRDAPTLSAMTLKEFKHYSPARGDARRVTCFSVTPATVRYSPRSAAPRRNKHDLDQRRDVGVLQRILGHQSLWRLWQPLGRRNRGTVFLPRRATLNYYPLQL